ncbi:MAG: beta-ketoacyl synthase N-terminal-like domain-containing protein [Brevinematales bacterium]
MYRVAIVGLGIVSCLGSDHETVTESLKNGKSGIVVDPERIELGFRSPLTGKIKGFIKPELSNKQKRTLTEEAIQAYYASMVAINQAGWREEDIVNPETGIIIGNDSTTIPVIESTEIVKNEKRTISIGATRIFMSLNSHITMNLNTLIQTKGANWTISGACASGGHAIGQAMELISHGRQERIISGGVQEINWQSVCSFDATEAFSTNIENPEGASKPFDKNRDGLIPSGGAAIVALERMDLAEKRGANILGEVVAYSFSSDGFKLSVPSGEGLERCIRDVIKRANIKPEDIDYICAHATSTPVGDLKEAEAIYKVFGDNMPWVSSIKSMTGHEMWMAGASQVVYSLLMSKGGFIAPNINFKEQDENAPHLRIAKETIDKKPRLILLNSAGFGGTNCCLIVRAF